MNERKNQLVDPYEPLPDAFPWHTQWDHCAYEIVEEPWLGRTVPIIKPVEGSEVKRTDAIWRPSLKGEAVKQPKTSKERGPSPHGDLARLDLRNAKEIKSYVDEWGLLGCWEVGQYRNWKPASSLVNSIRAEARFNGDPIPQNEPEKAWYGDADARQEPLQAFVKAAWHFQQWVLKTIDFKKVTTAADRERLRHAIVWGFNAGPCPHDKLRDNLKDDVPGHLLVSDGSVNPRLVWDETEQKWVFGWQYKSLLHACYFAVGLDLIEGKDRAGGFAQCRNESCNRLYLAVRTNQEYCCTNCARAQATREWRRDKAKKEEALHNVPIQHEGQ